MKVLVVDDEASVRSLCERALAAEGHKVRCAASGDEAIRMLGDGFELVLSDLTMPGQAGGIEVARSARAAGSADVILMTAHPELDSALCAMRQGVYDYLIKPFSVDSLAITVARCDEKRRLSAELTREKALRFELERTHAALTAMGKVRETFGQFATPEVARLILAGPEEFRKRGERRLVTVLFADVRGFTRFTRLVTPEAAVADVNAVLTVLIEVVQAAGGMVNKFTGDGIMAIFGAPLDMPGHAHGAARAALAAQGRLEALAEARRRAGAHPLRVGIGLNTGPAIAGCLGTTERTEYTVIGHAVNVAARFEAIAAPGQILVGGETAEAIEGKFALRSVGPLGLPGVDEPLEAFELLGPA